MGGFWLFGDDPRGAPRPIWTSPSRSPSSRSQRHRTTPGGLSGLQAGRTSLGRLKPFQSSNVGDDDVLTPELNSCCFKRSEALRKVARRGSEQARKHAL